MPDTLEKAPARPETEDRAGFRLAAFGAVLVVVLFAGYGLHHDPTVQPNALIGQAVPSVALPPLAGGDAAPLKASVAPHQRYYLCIDGTGAQDSVEYGRLLQERFGRITTRHLEHAPTPLRRSVLYEMEREFAADFSRTAASPCR